MVSKCPPLPSRGPLGSRQYKNHATDSPVSIYPHLKSEGPGQAPDFLPADTRRSPRSCLWLRVAGCGCLAFPSVGPAFGRIKRHATRKRLAKREVLEGRIAGAFVLGTAAGDLPASRPGPLVPFK
jgi:hypothetical protein